MSNDSNWFMSDPLRQLRTDKSVLSEESLGDNIILLYLYTRDQTQAQHLLSHFLQEEAGYASVSESLPRLQHPGHSVTIKYTYQGDIVLSVKPLGVKLTSILNL